MSVYFYLLPFSALHFQLPSLGVTFIVTNDIGFSCLLISVPDQREAINQESNQELLSVLTECDALEIVIVDLRYSDDFCVDKYALLKTEFH